MPDIKDRVTVVETVYHRPFNAEATSVESRFTRDLESNEQVYRRHLLVTEEWKPLDCGWLKDAGVGMLVLHNEEGRNLQTRPFQEEKEAISQRVVELAYGPEDHQGWLILPGESMRACPSNAKGLFVRCRKGTAQIIVNLIPV